MMYIDKTNYADLEEMLDFIIDHFGLFIQLWMQAYPNNYDYFTAYEKFVKNEYIFLEHHSEFVKVLRDNLKRFKNSY